MNKELLDIYKDIPDAVGDSINMKDANSVIDIYTGVYKLKNDTEEIEIQGKIAFEWFANSGVYFYGNPKVENEKLFRASDHNETYSIIIDGLEFGKGFITKFEFGSHTETRLKGTIVQQAILGDKSIPVEKIRFSVPNLREFLGQPVKRKTEKNISTSRDRIILEDDKYILTIDKCSDFKKRKENLEVKGGYIILYNGELINKKGSITHEDTKDLFYCLDTFLTFLNGRRTSALFIQGIHDEQVIWTDFTNYFVDSYKAVQTWPQRLSITGINELWKSFKSLWKEPDDKNFLTSLIHWYVESNGHKGFSEGSIILAQTALELVYNWWIVEHKKMILGKDSENISASNKIRLLLSQLNISGSIPTAFTNLKNFKDTTDNVDDAPDAIVYIRNAIVHSQEEKRKKLSTIHYQAKYEALQVYIWYIEMALLCILNYNGNYFNRCSKEVYAIKAEEQVPWKK